MKSIYFPGLNGLRFIAALAVIISHIEGFKNFAGISNLKFIPFIDQLGSQGVKIFFALSGFLITYLLLSEQENKGKIDIQKFYLRRILRIWPLYFLIIILGAFVIPYFLDPAYFPAKLNPQLPLKLTLMISMLPNLVYYVFGHIFILGVLWSIGTEEQFYLFWPHIFKKPKKNLLKILLVLLFSIFSIKILCDYIFSSHILAHISYLDKAARIIPLILQYDCMIIGGITATLYFYKNEKILSFLYSKVTQVITFLTLLTLLIFNPNLFTFSNIIYSGLYAIIILNVATNKESIIKLRNRVLDFFGQISYGMYMYHSIAIIFTLTILQNLLKGGNTDLIFNIFLYVFSFLLTVLFSSVSYYFFEKPILKLKSKFTVISSTNNSKDIIEETPEAINLGRVN